MVLERLNFKQNGHIDPKKHNFGRKSKTNLSGVTPYPRFNDIGKTILIE